MKPKQYPVFDRKDVENFVNTKFDSPPRGYRVGYHDPYNKNCLHTVKTLDEIDWHRVRRLTVLFPEGHPTSILIDGDEAIRDGIRLNTEKLKDAMHPERMR